MPAEIRFRCYFCHRVHTLDVAAAGKRGRCVCGKLMLVPAPAERGEADALPLAKPVDGGGSQEVSLEAAMPQPDADTEATRPAPGPGTPREETTARLPTTPVQTAQALETRRKERSPMLGWFFLLLSVVALGAGIVHCFFIESVSMVKDPNYLTLPQEFWGTVLFALFVGLLLEGAGRIRRPGS